jgi:hypothetical protein
VTVLTIRAHKRFAVCCKVRLCSRTGIVADGLLIEVSLEGCRISNVAPRAFAAEDIVDVEIEGFTTFGAHVRWQHDKIVGLRLTRPFHCNELINLVNFCRSESEVQEAARA